MFAEFDQKLCFFFEEFEEFEVVLFGVERDSGGSCLGTLVDLLDEGIDGFTCQDGDLFIFFHQEVVELVEEVGVVFGRDQIFF